MTARVLVVDDIVANNKLLEAWLTAEYFEVTCAASGAEALALVETSQIDIVLLDVMMPDMDGFEVCRRLKADPCSSHIPVVMVTALDQPADRVRGLEIGADDFLTKPVNDLALVTRVRSLARLKTLVDELRMRAVPGGRLAPEADDDATSGRRGRILLVEDRRSSAERLAQMLRTEHEVVVDPDAAEALFKAAEGDFDLVIVSLGLQTFDPLRLCSQLRSLERTRLRPILLLAEAEDQARLLRALDLGVNDYLQRPVDRLELLARTRTQVRRRRFLDRLRESVYQTVEMAITDPLTGVYNRRYLEAQFPGLVEQSCARGKRLAVFLCDIDHFKSINDTHGHDAGDEVLREFARRLKRSVRGSDLCCRYGGEEFVAVMPETDMRLACAIAERVRHRMAGEPFPLRNGDRLDVTVSVGVAALERTNDTPETILKRADQALYRAKRGGRNRVVADAA